MKPLTNASITVLILTLLLMSQLGFGQGSNVYTFIEPNVSVAYDSNYFKVGQRYSNTFYETEGYDFSYLRDTANKVRIHINANHGTRTIPKHLQDSILLVNIKYLQGIKNDSFEVVYVDTVIKSINGFSLAGFVGYDKINKQYGAMIGGFHISSNDLTEVTYRSENRNNLEEEYQVLNSFLQNFKSYSTLEMEKEDSLLKARYTVLVTPTTTVADNFTYRKKTYSGTVSVKEPLAHKVAEVRLATSLGLEIFTPDAKGMVPIISYDEQRGLVVKKGDLILLNSFGKKVKVPFTFSYENHGAK